MSQNGEEKLNGIQKVLDFEEENTEKRSTQNIVSEERTLSIDSLATYEKQLKSSPQVKSKTPYSRTPSGNILTGQVKRDQTIFARKIINQTAL